MAPPRGGRGRTEDLFGDVVSDDLMACLAAEVDGLLDLACAIGDAPPRAPAERPPSPAKPTLPAPADAASASTAASSQVAVSSASSACSSAGRWRGRCAPAARPHPDAQATRSPRPGGGVCVDDDELAFARCGGQPRLSAEAEAASWATWGRSQLQRHAAVMAELDGASAAASVEDVTLGEADSDAGNSSADGFELAAGTPDAEWSRWAAWQLRRHEELMREWSLGVVGPSLAARCSSCCSSSSTLPPAGRLSTWDGALDGDLRQWAAVAEALGCGEASPAAEPERRAVSAPSAPSPWRGDEAEDDLGATPPDGAPAAQGALALEPRPLTGEELADLAILRDLTQLMAAEGGGGQDPALEDPQLRRRVQGLQRRYLRKVQEKEAEQRASAPAPPTTLSVRVSRMISEQRAKEDRNLTFRPSITPAARRLGRQRSEERRRLSQAQVDVAVDSPEVQKSIYSRRVEQMLSEMRQREARECTFRPAITPAAQKAERVHRTGPPPEPKREILEKRLAKMRAEQRERETEECTFRPALVASRKPPSAGSPGGLHSPASSGHAQLTRRARALLADLQRVYAECTFKPQLTPRRPPARVPADRRGGSAVDIAEATLVEAAEAAAAKMRPVAKRRPLSQLRRSTLQERRRPSAERCAGARAGPRRDRGCRASSAATADVAELPTADDDGGEPPEPFAGVSTANTVLLDPEGFSELLRFLPGSPADSASAELFASTRSSRVEDLCGALSTGPPEGASPAESLGTPLPCG